MKIPIDIKSGKVAEQKPKDIVVGIDLGTTNSLIAFAKDNIPYPIASSDGYNIITPSVIYINDGEIMVGSRAKEYLKIRPKQTIYSIKRLMGKSYQDIAKWHKSLGYTVLDNGKESMPKVLINEKFYNPVELSSYILKELKKAAENALQLPITKAVITVPAYFNDVQRQATRDAGKLAGLDVLRIINEPTAAALAYGIGLRNDELKTIAVYDLGGGTFDISILHLEEGIFDVLSTHGDTFLGGDDIDKAIVDHWLSDNSELLSKRNQNDNLAQELRLLAEKAKIQVNEMLDFSEQIDNCILSLNHSTFIEIVSPIVEKTIDSCELALQDAKISRDDIDNVLLVGGSSRLNYVRQRLKDVFGDKLVSTIDPDQVVALGAAVQADILAGNRKDIILLDITPLSLGIETVGGLMDTIIPRNTKVPHRAGRQYTTSIDGQKNLRITAYQGERDLVIHNRKLGQCLLKDIPPMPAGIPKIEVQFILDPDGILTIKAKELRSETETKVEIKATYGISDEDMALMLIDSLQNAEKDKDQRAILEAINEGNNILHSTDKFVIQNANWLSNDEVNLLKDYQNRLAKAIQSSDKQVIENAMHELNTYATPLAHKALDINIGSALKGKNL